MSTRRVASGLLALTAAVALAAPVSAAPNVAPSSGSKIVGGSGCNPYSGANSYMRVTVYAKGTGQEYHVYARGDATEIRDIHVQVIYFNGVAKWIGSTAYSVDKFFYVSNKASTNTVQVRFKQSGDFFYRSCTKTG